MRDILPDNLVIRRGDTLEDDWPYFDEDDPHGTYKPFWVDAVVSNPPYSQSWEPLYEEPRPEAPSRSEFLGIKPLSTNKSEKEVVYLIGKLRGNEFDMKELGEFQSLLQGGKK
ncbi:MAG: SAM-dependent methyltransferase [Treponema sp.]|nr:SAM-dependent methyltransferase [Treponema sp.]